MPWQVHLVTVLKDHRELCAVIKLSLWVTKVTAQALGLAIATIVVQKHDLWLELVEMKEAKKLKFLDIPQAGLFDEEVEAFTVHGSAVNTSCFTVPRPLRSSPAQHCRPVAALSAVPAPTYTEPPVQSQCQRLQKKTGSTSCQPTMKSLPKDSNWSSEWTFAQCMQSSPKDGKDHIHFPSGGPGLSDFCENFWFNFKREGNVRHWRESFLKKEQISHPLHITPVNDVIGSHGHDGHALNTSDAVSTNANPSPPGAVQQCMPTCLLLLHKVLWCGPWAPVSDWALRGDLPLYMAVSLDMGSHALKLSCLRNSTSPRASHWLARLEPDPALKIRGVQRIGPMSHYIHQRAKCTVVTKVLPHISHCLYFTWLTDNPGYSLAEVSHGILLNPQHVYKGSRVAHSDIIY